MTTLEKNFEGAFMANLAKIYPGMITIKTEPGYIQGFPDRIFLWKNKWGALEFKREKNAIVQPNQAYYIDLLNSMSYASFVNPESVEEVLHEIQSLLNK